MPTCSAPGCRSGYASAAANPGPRHFFKPPKDPDLLKTWQNAISRKNFKVGQSATMDPMRPEHLESLWHSARNRKTEALLKVLQTYFDKAQNCFECAFLLMRGTSDFYESRPNSLAVTIMNVFQEWLSEHKEVYAAFLTDDIKRMALLAVLKQTNPFLIALVCDVYKLEENGAKYMDIVQNLLLRKRFSEASTVVASLKLHGYFTLEDIPIPLFLMDKMALLESYLEGQPKLQKELLIFLDNLYHDGNLADGVISNLNGKMISRDRNHPKTLEKIISRLLKQYGLPGETCPHVHYKRSKNALRYLFFKKYVEDDYSEPGWREMVCVSVQFTAPEVVGTNSSLQRDLLNELLWANDYESALNFAVKLCVPDRQWPRAIRSFMVQCGPEKVQELIESWNSYRDQDDPSKYLPFRLELCDVEMVDTADGLENCIEIIKNYNLVGIDAEWKPTMGLTTARLSLVQLAVWDNVFVLDMLKLSEILSEEQWGQLYTDVLGSNEILKLGFGIAEDLKLLAETIKFPGRKVQNIVDLCSFAEKLRCDWPFLMEPKVPKVPGHKGLSELTRTLLGLPLNKNEQCSDWENRPLRLSQMIYAAVDAFCLLEVYEELCKRADAVNMNMRQLLEEATDAQKGAHLRRRRPQKYKSQVPRQHGCKTNNGKR